MATIAVKLAVIFSLFIISQARSPFNLPANEFLPSVITSSESDTSNKDATTTTTTFPTIRLPSEKSSDSNIFTSTAQPMEIRYDVSFRPINRHVHHQHMHVTGPFNTRFPHRCGHHHHRGRHGRPRGQMVSYGNDMLMADKTTFGPVFHGAVGQIPAWWGEYHGEKFPFEVNGESLTEKSGHVEVEEKEGTQEMKNGFVNRVRKFLLNRF